MEAEWVTEVVDIAFENASIILGLIRVWLAIDRISCSSITSV